MQDGCTQSDRVKQGRRLYSVEPVYATELGYFVRTFSARSWTNQIGLLCLACTRLEIAENM